MPMLQEVVEDLSSNRLSTDEYPYVRPPTSESMSEHPLRSLLPSLLAVTSFQPTAASLAYLLWIWPTLAQILLVLGWKFQRLWWDMAALDGQNMAR